MNFIKIFFIFFLPFLIPAPRNILRKRIIDAILCFPLKLLPSTCPLRDKCPPGIFHIICRIKFTSISHSKLFCFFIFCLKSTLRICYARLPYVESFFYYLNWHLHLRFPVFTTVEKDRYYLSKIVFVYKEYCCFF